MPSAHSEGANERHEVKTDKKQIWIYEADETPGAKMLGGLESLWDSTFYCCLSPEAQSSQEESEAIRWDL